MQNSNRDKKKQTRIFWDDWIKQLFILQHRRMLRLNAGQRYRNKTLAKEALNEKREAIKDIPPDEVEDVFHTITQQEVDMAKNRTWYLQFYDFLR